MIAIGSRIRDRKKWGEGDLGPWCEALGTHRCTRCDGEHQATDGEEDTWLWQGHGMPRGGAGKGHPPKNNHRPLHMQRRAHQPPPTAEDRPAGVHHRARAKEACSTTARTDDELGAARQLGQPERGRGGDGSGQGIGRAHTVTHAHTETSARGRGGMAALPGTTSSVSIGGFCAKGTG
jgi:hypothetical protein